MPGPQADLGGTRRPRRKVKRTTPTPPSSSAGGRGPQRGKPDAIQERRRKKGAAQGVRVTRQNSVDTQPSGRGRGRNAPPVKEALAGLRAEDVYGETERGQLANIRDRKALTRAQVSQAEKAAESARSAVNDDNGLVDKVLRAEVTPSFYEGAPSVANPLGGPKGQVRAGTVGDLLEEATYVVGAGGGAKLAAEAAAAKLAGKTAAKTGAKRVAKTKAAQAVAKPVKATGRAVAKPAKKLGSTRGAQATKRGAKAAGRKGAQAARSKPGKATIKTAKVASAPIRVPLRKASQHPFYSAGAIATGPGAVKAQQEGDPRYLTAAAEGTGKALASPKTYVTTVKGIPSLVAAPIGIAANAGATVYKGARSEAVPDVLGGGKFSGKEVAEPSATAAKSLYGFGKEMGATLASGDADRIEKGFEDDYGLWPLAMAGIPGMKPIGRAVGKAMPKRVKRAAANHAERREEADAAAKLKTRIGRAEKQAVNPIAKPANRVKGTKRATHNRNVHIEPKDSLRMMVKEGIDLDHPNAERNIAKVLEAYPERPREVSDTAKTSHDAANFLLAEHRRLRTDKHYREALNAARVKAVETDTHTRAKFFHQAQTWGVDLPDARYSHIRDGIKQANRAHQLRINGVAPKEIATTLGVPVAKVDEWLATSKADRVAETVSLEKQAEADFEAEMLALRDREGLVEPHYVRDSSLIDEESGHPVANVPRGDQTSFATQRKEGSVRERGLESEGFDSYISNSVKRPRVIRAKHGDAKRFARDAFTTVTVTKKGGEKVDRRAVNREEWRQVSTGKKPQVDPTQNMLWDSQHWNRAVRDPNSTPESLAKSFEEAGDQARILRDMDDPSHKDKKYGIVADARMGEYVAQIAPRPDSKLATLARKPQELLLAYSPSWLLTQPPATAAVTSLGVNPVSQVLGHRAARDASPEAHDEFAVAAGSSSGTGWEGAKPPRKRGEVPADGDIPAMRRSRTGRALHGLLMGKSAGKVDRWSTGKLREAQLEGKLYQELHGPVRRMGRAVGLIEKLDKDLRGKTFPEQLEILAKRPAEVERIGKYIADTSGDWNSIIRSGPFNEAKIAQWITFYPFIRFSMTWYAKYARQHPAKAVAQAFLATWNQNQLEQIIRERSGGKIEDPSFFTGWAAAPLYLGTGDELGEATSVLPLHRIAPGANALVEAIGNNTKGPQAFISALNPWVGAGLGGLTGVNPLTGRVSEAFGDAEGLDKWKEGVRIFGATVLQWPAALRHVDQATGKKASRGVLGKEDSPASLMFDVLSGLAASPVRTALLSAFAPIRPKDSSRYAQEAELSDLLHRKFGPEGDIGKLIEAGKQEWNAGNKEKATIIAARVLDSIAADKALSAAYTRYGVDYEDLGEEAQGRVNALSAESTFPKSWNPAVEQMRDEGIPVDRILRIRRKVRRIKREAASSP